MLNPWLELDGVEQRLSVWSDLTGLDLIRLGTTADIEEVKDTAVTQPLIVALSLIGLEELRRRFAIPEGTPVAGHSVGELTAAAAAGVLSFDDAVQLAAIRGREMAAACGLEPTGMSAVVGGDSAEVRKHLEQLGLDAANHNGAGQVVAAGHRSALEELGTEPPTGTRVRPLPVAGAFHTRFMAPARANLDKHASAIERTAPTMPLLSNADGTVVTDPDEVLHRMVDQITKPVRWDACMATLAELGIDAAVELPPAGALVGMLRREIKGIKTIACKTPDQLDQVAEVLTTDDSRSES